ncbi:MAG: flagellar export chaperone FliS [Pseudomonadota bacterium]
MNNKVEGNGMYVSQYSTGAARYASVGIQTRVEDASPHRLIQMLFEAFIERVIVAKHALDRNDTALKGTSLTKAIAIIGGLKEALDSEQGGELAGNLRDLYTYVELQLIKANASNDEAIMDECIRLIREIKSAWDQIPEHLRHGVKAGS